MDAPSADELCVHPVVVAACEAAWADSFPDDPAMRHEEGGYIYMNPTTGDVVVRRALPGRRNSLNLSVPPVVVGSYLVATYHTHPEPSSYHVLSEPSPQDREIAADSGVPWLVVSHDGVFWTGPDRRVGGLSGDPGYPL